VTGRVLCVGIAVEDLVFRVPSALVPGHKNFASSQTVAVGGPAASAASAIAGLGGASSLVAPLGDDAAGAVIVRGLVEAGVDASNIVTLAGAATPISTVVVDADGERTIVNQCEDMILMTDFPLGIDAMRDFDCVLVDVRWQTGAVRALELASESSIPTVVDIDATDRAVDPRILRLGGHLVFSRHTLEAFTRTADAREGLAAVADQTPAVVAVTLGAGGALVSEDGKVIEVPSFPVDVVDTLGAGDIFHGSYALGVADGLSATVAARRASAAAAIACSRPTGTRRFPTAEEVDALLESTR